MAIYKVMGSGEEINRINPPKAPQCGGETAGGGGGLASTVKR